MQKKMKVLFVLCLSLGAGLFSRANAAFYLSPSDELQRLGQMGKQNMSRICSRGSMSRVRATNTVTHYYLPLYQKARIRNVEKFARKNCHRMEGVCRFFGTDHIEYIANYNHPTIPLSRAYCKSGIGYEMETNCTHPCRSLAASTYAHRPGEVLFFPELVGKTCGTGPNRMIHDGFMVVNDTGSPKHFNREGRLDFYWGGCRNFKNGVCYDGGKEISEILSTTSYCRAWRPQDPTYNQQIKDAFVVAVRTEAIERGDRNAASFDLDDWVGTHGRLILELKAKKERRFRLRSEGI